MHPRFPLPGGRPAHQLTDKEASMTHLRMSGSFTHAACGAHIEGHANAALYAKGSDCPACLRAEAHRLEAEARNWRRRARHIERTRSREAA